MKSQLIVNIINLWVKGLIQNFTLNSIISKTQGGLNMKNLKVCLVVFSVLLGLMLLNSGCATTERGYQKPIDEVKATPLKEVYPGVVTAKKEVSPEERTSTDQKLDELKEALDRLTSELSKRPFVKPPHEAKKPEPGIFSQQLAEVAKKEAAAKKEPQKKIYQPSYQVGEFAKLKDRVARIEEIIEFEHPGSDIMSVLYGPAKGFLDTKAKARTKRYFELWLDGLIDINGSNSYASKPPPRNPELTNEMISQLRSQELRNFLKELGMPEEELAKMKWQFLGPTDRFSDGKISTLIIEWIRDPAEIAKRKAEREKYRKPPMK